jgi:putative ABC transport system substrate-binding protein
MAYLGNLSGTGGGSPHEALVARMEHRGLDVLVINVTEAQDVEPAFQRARDWGAELLLPQNVIPLNVPRDLLPGLALRERLPAGSVAVQWAQAGFLLAHDYDRLAVARRGAWYVARILEGAYPGDLPFERPASFVVVVNRTTLALLGLTLPEHVALQVTQWEG